MADRVGQQLGNYRLVRALGEGGFAEVYLSEHIYLKTQAAIKVLKTRVVQDDMESFLTEARTVAKLVHPQIVRVLEFGVEGEVPFLVMDYAPNGTLRQRHPKGSRLPVPNIVTYVRQVAAALQYAHDDRLIHRDVKPENMLLGRRNDVLLSDFGIALVAQSSRYQSVQDVTGTISYMAPEQIQGKPRPASDQYSLGITVYEWLTGERPFRGSFTELCTQHMFATVPPLREKVPTIPASVEQVVMIALAKDYKQRFQSVLAFANALEQASTVEQAKQPVPEPPEIVTLESTVLAAPPPSAARPIAVPLPASTPSPGMSHQPSPPVQRTPPLAPPVAENNATSLHTEPAATFSPVSGFNSGEKLIPDAARHDERPASMWRIGVPQIVAMIVGFMLFGLFTQSFITLPFGSILPAIIVPLFLGAVFGPWVGLVTGLGVLLNYLISGTGALRINEYVGFALGSVLAGLIPLVVRGRYNSFRTIVLADLCGALATLCGIGFALLTDGLPGSALGNAFTRIVLTNIVYVLIVLPILLLIYNALISAISKRKQASQPSE